MPKRPRFVGCTIKHLPPHMVIPAAETAATLNPANAPNRRRLHEVYRSLLGPKAPPPDPVLEPLHIAVLTTKYWGSSGVKLTVGFMETTTRALADKIIGFMNQWSKTANVTFTYTQSVGDAQVRISRGGSGYWSFLGTDILHIPRDQPTMNLEGFVLNTPESEYFRVVCHETGHTLGCPHEHMRAALVALLDPAKTIAYFERTQGWSAQEIEQQVLKPLDEASLMATPADQDSVMCYQIPGECTKNGQPIRGGANINPSDAAFIGKLYPKAVAPPPPPPPPPSTFRYLATSNSPITFTQQQ